MGDYTVGNESSTSFEEKQIFQEQGEPRTDEQKIKFCLECQTVLASSKYVYCSQNCLLKVLLSETVDSCDGSENNSPSSMENTEELTDDGHISNGYLDNYHETATIPADTSEIEKPGQLCGFPPKIEFETKSRLEEVYDDITIKYGQNDMVQHAKTTKENYNRCFVSSKDFHKTSKFQSQIQKKKRRVNELLAVRRSSRSKVTTNYCEPKNFTFSSEAFVPCQNRKSRKR